MTEDMLKKLLIGLRVITQVEFMLRGRIIEQAHLPSVPSLGESVEIRGGLYSVDAVRWRRIQKDYFIACVKIHPIIDFEEY